MSFSGSGSGTEADPYIITTASQLKEVSEFSSSVFELGQNIDAGSIDGPLIFDEFREKIDDKFNTQPKIPNSPSGFEGTLDGKGFTISNLSVIGDDGRNDQFSAEAGQSAFVFSSIKKRATVKNINFNNLSVRAGNGGQASSTGFTSGDGGFAAGLTMVNKGTIKNISFDSDSDIKAGDPGGPDFEASAGNPGNAAGIAYENKGEIDNCEVTCPVTGKNAVPPGSEFEDIRSAKDGGRAAGISIRSEGPIKNSVVTGEVKSGDGGSAPGTNDTDVDGGAGGNGAPAAGIVFEQNSEILNCSCSASIISGSGGDGRGPGSSGDAAGISFTSGDIKFCSFTGDISIGSPGNIVAGADSVNGGSSGNIAGISFNADSVENTFAKLSLSTPDGKNGSTGSRDEGRGEPGGSGGNAGDAVGLVLSCNQVKNSFVNIPSTNLGNGGDASNGGNGNSDFSDGGNGGDGGDAGSVFGLTKTGNVSNSYVRGDLSVDTSGGDGGDGGLATVLGSRGPFDSGDGGNGGDAGKSVAFTEQGSADNAYVTAVISSTGSAGSKGAGGGGGGDDINRGENGTDGTPAVSITAGGQTENLFIDESSVPNDVSGTRLPRSALKQKSSFDSFNFNINWNLDSNLNDGFPNLRGVTPGGGSPPPPQADFKIKSGRIPIVGDEFEVIDDSSVPNSVRQNPKFNIQNNREVDGKKARVEPDADGPIEVSFSIENREGDSDSVTKNVLVTTDAEQGVRMTGAGILR